MKINLIQPKIFDVDVIQSFFTMKNELLNDSNRQIKGLNLGFNTNEAPEIITQNRKELFEWQQINAEWAAFANQVHGARLKTVMSGGTFAQTDGLVTQVPGLALVIQVADCAAILLADEQSKTIAAIHAGWRGAAGDIVPRTLQKMRQLGVKAENCKAFIGPCICETNFEVGAEVAEQFPDNFVDYQNYEKPHINLKEFLKYQLQKGGIESKQIEVHQGCTVQERKYYSYRREGEQSGRMMAVIKLKEQQF